jgi:primosomal protein N' (replication factor Y)
MMVVLITSEDYDTAVRTSEALAAKLKNLGRTMENVMVVGPGDASIGKINNIYRRVIYVKAMGMDSLAALRNLADNYNYDNADNIMITVDINPINSY